MSAPFFMATGRGVVMRNWSSGGVIASRFPASAKKANTVAAGWGSSSEVWSRCSVIQQ